MKTKNKKDQINVSHCFEISAYIAKEEKLGSKFKPQTWCITKYVDNHHKLRVIQIIILY